MREIAHAPGDNRDARRIGQATNARAMEMVVVGMCDQNEVDFWKVFDFATSALEALHEKNPVSKIWIDQEVQVSELTQEGGVSDPRDGHLTIDQLREYWAVAISASWGEPPFPYHFVKEGPRIKMVARGKLLESPGNAAFTPMRPCAVLRVHRKYLSVAQFLLPAE